MLREPILRERSRAPHQLLRNMRSICVNADTKHPRLAIFWVGVGDALLTNRESFVRQCVATDRRVETFSKEFDWSVTIAQVIGLQRLVDRPGSDFLHHPKLCFKQRSLPGS
jgi:hypothetical protein